MKKIYFIFFVLIFFSASAQQYAWTQKRAAPGTFTNNRLFSISFSIGLMGYMGTGIDTGARSDFWRYDTQNDRWTQKADFAGGRRDQAIGFSIGGYGYVGTGVGQGFTWSDIWQYDTTANTWTRKNDFGGGIRANAVTFVIGNYAYVGGGYSGPGYDSTFWQYNSITDTWLRKSDFAGIPRANAVAFTVGGYGYMGSGTYNSNGGSTDFWQYDTTTDVWSRKADLSGSPRQLAFAFTIANLAFVGTGLYNGHLLNEIWLYDYIADQWHQTSIYPGCSAQGIFGAFAYVIDSCAYIGAGGSCNDFWQYCPSQLFTNTDQPLTNSWQLKAAPNPAHDFINLSLPQTIENGQIDIFNFLGEKVYSTSFQSASEVLRQISVGELHPGIYMVQLTDGKQRWSEKIIKE